MVVIVISKKKKKDLSTLGRKSFLFLDNHEKTRHVLIIQQRKIFTLDKIQYPLGIFPIWCVRKIAETK